MKIRQKGQILIIFLLILVVGLALVLSVASRSITDIRLTTTSDESNRAYFAAEAGIEEALKRLQDPATPDNLEAELDFTSINQTTAKIKASPLTTLITEAYEFPSLVAKDEVVQLSLLRDFNDDLGPSPVAASPSDSIDIYWGRGGPGGIIRDDINTTPAILITILYKDAVGDFKLQKYAFDNVVGRSNGFCHSSIPTGSVDTNVHTNGFDFAFMITLPIRDDATCGPTTITGMGSNKPILARIRLLYNDAEAAPVAVQATPGNGWNLPNQGSEVESTGTTTSGVTRKLRVTQQYPALPSIFDYVLFSGGDLIK